MEVYQQCDLQELPILTKMIRCCCMWVIDMCTANGTVVQEVHLNQAPLRSLHLRTFASMDWGLLQFCKGILVT